MRGVDAGKSGDGAARHGLADAKQAGILESVKPVLDALIHEARFWIGSELYKEVLKELGE